MAAYDLGATAKQLQAIYDAENGDLDDINLTPRNANAAVKEHLDLTVTNWTEFLGEEKYADVITDRVRMT